jgi:hypothetical protein
MDIAVATAIGDKVYRNKHYVSTIGYSEISDANKTKKHFYIALTSNPPGSSSTNRTLLKIAIERAKALGYSFVHMQINANELSGERLIQLLKAEKQVDLGNGTGYYKISVLTPL